MSPDADLLESGNSKPDAASETSSSSQADEETGATFHVYERDLLLHLWSSPLVASASQSLPPKLKDWYAELLSDGSLGHGQASSAHPRHANRRQPRHEDDGSRGLQPMGDFRAEGARPRRHAAHEDARTSARNERRQQQQPQQPPPLRSDNGSWRTSSSRLPPTPGTGSTGGALQEDMPAWMDDGPSDATPSWFSSADGDKSGDAPGMMPLGNSGGHIDSIQAFKAQMRAEERRKLRRDNDLPSEPSTPVEASKSPPNHNDPAILSSSRSPAPPTDSRAPSALDALFSNAQPLSEAKSASPAATTGAPRSSRFAKMFKADGHEGAGKQSQPSELGGSRGQRQQQDADVTGFMSSLTGNGKGSQGDGNGGGGQTGPATAPLAMPSQASLEKQQGRPPPAQDGDMLRVMQMLQSSSGLPKSPVNGVAHAQPMSLPQSASVSPTASMDTFGKQQQQPQQQSRRDFARPQQSPVNGLGAPPSPSRQRQPQPQSMDAFQSFLASARPSQTTPSFQDNVAAPHSVGGLLNLGNSPGGTTATNAPRFAQQLPQCPPRADHPPRMMQHSPEVHQHSMAPGYAIPRTQPFSAQVMNQPPPPPRSIYELQSMGLIPGGASGMRGPPPLPQIYGGGSPQQQMGYLHQGYAQFPPQQAQGIPGRPGLSPDLMTLFANAGGQVPQYR